MNSICNECSKDITSNSRKCGFNCYYFYEDNYNCKILGHLRTLAWELELATFYNDNWTAKFKFNTHQDVYLRWYKQRATMEMAFILDTDANIILDFTLEDALYLTNKLEVELNERRTNN